VHELNKQKCDSYIFVRIRRGRRGLEDVNDCFVCESERVGMRAAYTWLQITNSKDTGAPLCVRMVLVSCRSCLSAAH
jgi:hypothetical protein